MTGRNWTEELTAYVDGELPAEDRAALEAELAKNPGLRALLVKLERTVATVEALESPAPSPALRRAVLLGIAAPTWRERLVAWLSPPRLLPASALLAVGVAAVVVATRPTVPARPAVDEEQLELAQNLEVLEDLDLAGLDGAEDVEVVARLQELEKEP